MDENAANVAAPLTACAVDNEADAVQSALLSAELAGRRSVSGQRDRIVVSAKVSPEIQDLVKVSCEIAAR